MKYQAISGIICLVQNIRYPNISYTIYGVQNNMKYQDISGTIYPVQVIGGHKKLMVGPLPQATRTKPSFVSFPDISKTYLLAFVMPFYLW